jgi:hypothetical protein
MHCFFPTGFTRNPTGLGVGSASFGRCKAVRCPSNAVPPRPRHQKIPATRLAEMRGCVERGGMTARRAFTPDTSRACAVPPPCAALWSRDGVATVSASSQLFWVDGGGTGFTRLSWGVHLRVHRWGVDSWQGMLLRGGIPIGCSSLNLLLCVLTIVCN